MDLRNDASSAAKFASFRNYIAPVLLETSRDQEHGMVISLKFQLKSKMNAYRTRRIFSNFLYLSLILLYGRQI